MSVRGSPVPKPTAASRRLIPEEDAGRISETHPRRARVEADGVSGAQRNVMTTNMIARISVAASFDTGRHRSCGQINQRALNIVTVVAIIVPLRGMRPETTCSSIFAHATRRRQSSAKVYGTQRVAPVDL